MPAPRRPGGPRRFRGARGARRGGRGWGLAGLLGALVWVGALGVPPAGAATTTGAPTSVTLEVRGYGHGRGMGQYGALGYAIEDGWTYQQILDHYYGTLVDGGQTHLGTLAGAEVGSTGLTSDQAPITVALDQLAGQPVVVTSASAFTVSASGLGTPLTVPAGGAAKFQLAPGSPGTVSWEIWVNDGGGPGSCAGGAAGWGSPVASGVQDPTATPSSPAPFPASGPIDDQLLEVCATGGFYRGSISGAVLAGQPPEAETVDTLPLGQYVADTAAAESPGDWATDGPPGPGGQAAGFQQTEAQVVAVRSYAVAEALAGGYQGVADVCASTACQAYPGVADENPYDDLAEADTAGQVVLLPSGAPALTEYSASTGGETAPGSGPQGFAAVVDQGDGICTAQVCNPYHRYLATVPASAIEAAYPAIGTFSDLVVLQRNGLGPLGGRVETLQLVGSAGSVTTSAGAFVAAVVADTTDQLDALGGTLAASGILSDWFAPVSGTGSGAGEPGYWLVGADGGVFSFGQAPFAGSAGDLRLAAPIVGMAATPDGQGYWLVGADGGVFSFGDAPFDGSTYSDGLTGLSGPRPLAAPIVGMAATPDGQGYWLVGADGGVFSFGDARFFGSVPGLPVGQRPPAGVPVVGLVPTADGRGYWEVTSAGDVYSFGDAPFFGSAGDLDLAAPIVGMAATPDGQGYWLVGADGGVFSFGDAPYLGSLPALGLRAQAVALLPTPDGQGYLIVSRTGQVSAFGDAVVEGSAPPGLTDVVGGALDAGP